MRPLARPVQKRMQPRLARWAVQHGHGRGGAKSLGIGARRRLKAAHVRRKKQQPTAVGQGRLNVLRAVKGIPQTRPKPHLGQLQHLLPGRTNGGPSLRGAEAGQACVRAPTLPIQRGGEPHQPTQPPAQAMQQPQRPRRQPMGHPQRHSGRRRGIGFIIHVSPSY